MSENALSQIEERVSQLSISDQLRLIERLARRLQEQTLKPDTGLDAQLAQMATDPEIQAEIRKIEKEFAEAEADGLESN